MTATTDHLTRPVDNSVTGADIASRFPVALLLPASVGKEKRVRRARNLSLLAIVAAMVASAGLYSVSTSAADQADQELSQAQSRATLLSAQQAKYSEVPKVARQLAGVKADRASALGDEVLYSTVLAMITATKPGDVKLTQIQVTPTASVPGTSTPSDSNLAHVTMKASTAKYPTVAAWLDQLAADKRIVSPTVADATAQTTSERVIETEVSFDLAPSALSGRYGKAAK
jgi:hypothetical protein